MLKLAMNYVQILTYLFDLCSTGLQPPRHVTSLFHPPALPNPFLMSVFSVVFIFVRFGYANHSGCFCWFVFLFRWSVISHHGSNSLWLLSSDWCHKNNLETETSRLSWRHEPAESCNRHTLKICLIFLISSLNSTGTSTSTDKLL